MLSVNSFFLFLFFEVVDRILVLAIRGMGGQAGVRAIDGLDLFICLDCCCGRLALCVAWYFFP